MQTFPEDIYVALYNQKTKSVESYEALLPEAIHRDLFDFNKKEKVATVILEKCKNL
uniref:Uncharacterized protein n=1 Tax=viral metagenome TaxID=1070528 RepID=A0A6C0KSH6_9ZZZZ